MKPITILAIESSCDETSAAVLKNQKVLSNVIANQSVHAEFGGVVPELASRAHQSNILPVVDRALKEAGTALNDLDAIAYTTGPGLIGALMVGSAFAKGLSIALGKPLIEVHHMQAHVLAHFIEDETQRVPELPFLCLTVSGGHTQIVKVEAPLRQIIIGKTLDDAAGEAFDKAAKLLGLPYPGGPLLDQYAQKGDPKRFDFPIADIPELDFSFSGLKTAILYHLQKELRANENYISQNIHDLCASIQYTIVETLMRKIEKATKQFGIERVALAGGVSANSLLRSRFLELERKGFEVYLPKFEFCTDNAAMIGIYAYFKYHNGEFGKLSTAPRARWEV